VSKTETITKAQFARDHGWSESYVSKLLRQGKISVGDDGRINPVIAEQELEQNTGYTLHGRNGCSLAEAESDETDGDMTLVRLWLNFYEAVDLLRKAHPNKRLVKKFMLQVVQDLR